VTQAAIQTDRYVWFKRNPSADEWVPFEWDEPAYGGKHVAGEIVLARAAGTSGNLMSGLWRAASTAPGCEPDGSCRVRYSAPLGDENLCVLEGEATVTVVSTGKQHHLTPGTIMCHPKGVELLWETKPPFFKKYWVIWDSPKAATPSNELGFANINDNPGDWLPFSWEEAEGPQDCGELFFIKQSGSTGTMMCGIWRSGKGIHGCDTNGVSTIPYTAPLGDETIILLEGQVHIRDDETGEEYDLQAGDLAGYSHGHHITWTSKGPFVKKFWTITMDQIPAPAE